MRLNPGAAGFALADMRSSDGEAKLLPLNVFQYVLDKTEAFGVEFMDFFSR